MPKEVTVTTMFSPNTVFRADPELKGFGRHYFVGIGRAAPPEEPIETSLRESDGAPDLSATLRIAHACLALPPPERAWLDYPIADALQELIASLYLEYVDRPR